MVPKKKGCSMTLGHKLMELHQLLPWLSLFHPLAESLRAANEHQEIARVDLIKKKKRSGGVKVHGTGPSRLGPNYCKLLHETVPKNISVQEQKDMGSSLNVGTNLAKTDILRT